MHLYTREFRIAAYTKRKCGNIAFHKLYRCIRASNESHSIIQLLLQIAEVMRARANNNA